MDALRLSEEEHKFFEDLFQQCDLGKTAKIPKLVVGELLATSGLLTDVLLQIADMCGASRLGYFGRSQFYIALKLIAAAQQNFPLSFESFANHLDLPAFNMAVVLPKLANYDITMYNPPTEVQTSQSAVIMSTGGVLPPPPTKKHIRNISIPRNIMEPTLQAGHLPLGISHSQLPTVHHQLQPVVHLPNQPLSQAQNVPAAAQESTGWALFSSKDALDGTCMDVSGSAPDAAGTGEWDAFSGGHQSFRFDTASLSSADYATSEAESVDDVWTISDEQREYYVNQFLSMQPDLKSTINGAIAKDFFEKSRLPTKELSKIWKLSDVNRDGELTLQEFCTAMHLVVLRRNDIELPTILPPSLMPYSPTSVEPFSSDLPHDRDQPSGISPSPLSRSFEEAGQWQAAEAPIGQWHSAEAPGNQWHGTDALPSAWKTSEPGSPSLMQSEWTGSSGVQSPSTKPVNFDSVLIIDPDILHPVPMKLSPAAINSSLDEGERLPLESDSVSGEVSAYTARHRSSTVNSDAGLPPQLQGRPRPTPKKAQSVAAIGDRLLIQPPPLPVQHSSAGVTVPPMVPPRQRSVINADDDHRDSMADVFSFPDDHFASRQLDDDNFADFESGFGREDISGAAGTAYQAGGDNFLHESSDMRPVMTPTVTAPPLVLHQYSIRDKKEILNSIQQQKERNAMLIRLNSELNQELQEVMEQRISLEIQLEHLKPC